MHAENLGEDGDITKLSPTPRKSERERKTISYVEYNKNGAPDSEEGALENKDGQNNGLNRADSRKLGPAGVVKKSTYQENLKKAQELFDGLGKHEYAHIFNEGLDPDHPLYKDICKTYTTLSMIDCKLKIGHFQTTN